VPLFQRKGETLKKTLHKSLFRTGFGTAKPMIEISSADPQAPFFRKALQDPKKGDGVRPAGHGHKNPVAGLKHTVIFDRPFDFWEELHLKYDFNSVMISNV